MKNIKNVRMNPLDAEAFASAMRDCEYADVAKAFDENAGFKSADAAPIDVSIEELATTDFPDDVIPRITFSNEVNNGIPDTPADFYAFHGGRPGIAFNASYCNTRMFWLRTHISHALAEIMIPNREYSKDLELDQLEVLFSSDGRKLTCLIRMHEKHTVVGGEPGEIREGDIDVAVIQMAALPHAGIDINPILIRRVSLDCISIENLYRTADWCARFWNGLQQMMKKGIYDA